LFSDINYKLNVIYLESDIE